MNCLLEMLCLTGKVWTWDPPEPDDLLLGVSQPAGRRGVGRQSGPHQLRLPGRLEGVALGQQLEGLLPADAVLDVPQERKGYINDKSH